MIAIGSLITNAIERGRELEEKRDYIGISQIAYCMRKLYLQHTQQEKTELGTNVLLAFLTGSATHEAIQSLIWKHRGWLPLKYRKSEIKVECITPAGNVLKGHADLVATIDGVDTVIDFKVSSGGKFASVKRKGEPDSHYVDQLMLYGHCLQLDYCQLAYINKDSGETLTYIFTVDAERVKGLLFKYDNLMLHIKRGKEPQKAFVKPDDSWECSYCQYKGHCWQTTYIDKIDETVTIESALTEEYARLTKSKAEIDNRLTEIKEQVEAGLNGRDACGDGVKISYIAPAQTATIDKKTLAKLVDSSIIEQATKTKKKGGYYRWTLTQQKN